MGLLSVGEPLGWDETKEHADKLKSQGIKQFCEMYKHMQHTTSEFLRWGDEIEYMVVAFDHRNKRAQLSLVASELMPKLSLLNNSTGCCGTKWQYEFAEYMVEAIPGSPYQHAITDISTVECNMRTRRLILQNHLADNEFAFCITAFPRNGCPRFTSPEHPIKRGGQEDNLSDYFPVEAITQGHPRFKTLARNIKARRGDKVCLNVPVFRDANTPRPFVDPTASPNGKALQGHIYMDAMGFGMGCSCLQVTFEAADLNEARVLYDQLCPITPILMALGAASPVWKGFLGDVDCRWDVIGASVDDRNSEERDSQNPKHIKQSRYGCIDCYVSEEGLQFNDIDVAVNETHYKQLIDAGVDSLLAQHIAHLFIRDPLVAFVEQFEYKSNDLFHFETIQSTNWNNMRLKIPPADAADKIGWRIEFRTCELQFTEFENAAFVIFIILLTRVLLAFPINFLIPISMMQRNMRIAQKRNAVLDEKFAFRLDCANFTERSKCEECCKESKEKSKKGCYVVKELTIDEIINGAKGMFIGLVPLVKKYIAKLDVDEDSHCSIAHYLDFISHRASGKILTNAKWIRNFINGHPAYKRDSVVSELINYDMLMKVRELTERSHRDYMAKRVLSTCCN